MKFVGSGAPTVVTTKRTIFWHVCNLTEGPDVSENRAASICECKEKALPIVYFLFVSFAAHLLAMSYGPPKRLWISVGLHGFVCTTMYTSRSLIMPSSRNFKHSYKG
jgi:hypothetical protein